MIRLFASLPPCVAGLLLAAGGFAQDAAPADRNAVNSRARPGGMLADSPVTFPERGALPAQFPPDVKAGQFDPGEPDYFLFASPERSLAQVRRIQAAMPAGRFTPPTHDWRHLPRTRRKLTEGGPLHLMAIGDSIVNDTMRSGWVALLREAYPRADITATVYVRGGGGAQHFREADRLARNVFPRRPDLVFLGGISQRSIEDLAVLIGQLRAGLPEVEILLGTGAFGTTDPRDPAALAAAPHSGTGDYGRRLRALAEAERCAFLDFTTPWAEYLNSSGQHPHRFYRDVVHANEFGEQVLAKILMQFWRPGESAAPGLTRPIVGPDLVFEERDGLVAVEAEHFYKQTLTEKRAWQLTSLRHTPDVLPDGDPPHLEGASGGAYLEILPDTRRTHDDPLLHGENFANQPGRIGVLHYKVHFHNPGRYYVWARAYSTGTEDNGLHVGLNGQWPASGQRLQWCDGKDSWRWESKQRTEREHCGEPHLIHLDIPAAGEHEIQFSMREDGFEFDKFLLTLDRDFSRPEGVGPVPRVRHGVLPAAFAAAAPQAPAPANGDEPRKTFPAHWGSPPPIQTMDYRPLPGGYGFGSSTLAGWIQRNLDRDLAAAVTGPAKVSGELKRWHRVTLDFEGPHTREDAVPNPFLSYRLDVTFTHAASGETRIVPGFFAADGNAAETSATAGNVWRAHFSPPWEGEWRWRASFRSGEDVAIAARRDAGEPWAPLDGQSGSFVIGATDKTPPDFRARGHLEYVGERYLRFAGDGTRFLKGGPGSPEVMLGYADFDGTFRDLSRTNRPPSPNPVINLPALRDGLLRFAPHVRDWREGDPTWQGGKGKGLIGGLNYLSGEGANSIYFVTMSVNGDGMNAWPWVDPWIRDRFDISKLDQWEIVFNHAARGGIQLHIVTQETENDHLLDRGFLGRERKLYYRELVARFSHHPAITWNLGEENVQSPAQQKASAAWLRHLLPYRQHIVIHNDHWHAKNLRETFDPLLGGTLADLGWRDSPPAVDWRDGVVPLLTGPAIQDFFWPDVHTHVRHYVRASAEAGLPWVVTGDEMGGANFGTLPDADDPDHDDPRRLGLWASLMAGGAGVEWYFGWQNNSPFSDLSCEDWRTRENMYRQTKIALEFFHEHLPFWRMIPADEAVVGHGASGLIAPGELYAIYLPHGGGTRFDLGDHPGLYEIRWFNPRAGGEPRPGSIRQVRSPGLTWTGFPPADTSKDWLALVRRVPETAPATMQFPGAEWRELPPLEVGVHPNGLHHALNYWRMFSGTNGVDEVVMARRGVVFHRGRAVTNAHNVWSVTKSFTSTALGLLVADGRVTLETRAAELEPELNELYPAVTLRDFTTMTSGYDAAGRSRWGADSEDWSPTPYTPAPPLFAPGTKFAYWDEAQMMFGRVLTRAARRDLLDLLRERVFDPIGLQAAGWTTEGEVNGVAIRNGGTGLQLDALNLARFGHLFLNEGRWGSRQLLPPEWVREAARAQVSAGTPVADTDRRSTGGGGVYGFNWWVNGLRADGTRLLPDAPSGTFYASGLNNNLCLIIPEWEMVIVRMGVDGNAPAEVLNAFLRRLGMAVSPLGKD